MVYLLNWVTVGWGKARRGNYLATKSVLSFIPIQDRTVCYLLFFYSPVSFSPEQAKNDSSSYRQCYATLLYQCFVVTLSFLTPQRRPSYVLDKVTFLCDVMTSLASGTCSQSSVCLNQSGLFAVPEKLISVVISMLKDNLHCTHRNLPHGESISS